MRGVMKLKIIGKIKNIKKVTARNGLKMVKFQDENGTNLLLSVKSFNEMREK